MTESPGGGVVPAGVVLAGVVPAVAPHPTAILGPDE